MRAHNQMFKKENLKKINYEKPIVVEKCTDEWLTLW